MNCTRTDCTAAATIQWQRLAPADIHAQIVAAHEQLTGEPAPDDFEASTVAVFACDAHRVDDDRASRVHEQACSAPNGDCGCVWPDPDPAP